MFAITVCKHDGACMSNGNNTEQGSTNVTIPLGLADQIDKIVECHQFGFLSRAEFVKDAIRKSLVKYQVRMEK